MTSPLGDNVWIFHAGALGDHVMIWPLVRALARQGASVTIVGAGSHAKLCEKEVGGSLGPGCSGRVIGLDSEQDRFTRLWRGTKAIEPGDVKRGVATVLTLVALSDTLSGGRWHEGAAAMFPGAQIIFIDRPDRDLGARDRSAIWATADVAAHGAVAPAVNPDGPIVLYPGAGNDDKCLSQKQWGGIARQLLVETSLGNAPVLLPAGRNELERAEHFDGILRTVNHHSRIRPVPCPDLPTLTDHLRAARIFVGADTGPTHLAAQLGIPTLAIFGQTDPAIWSPVGPCVRIRKARHPWGITLIEPSAIVEQMLDMLRPAAGDAGAVPSV